MTYKCDVLFNLKDSEIDKAVVAFDSPLDATWPLDIINEALFHFYDNNDARPWIYSAEDNGLPVGYVVSERDDHLTDQDVLDAFYGMLQEKGLHDAENEQFTKPVPFSTAGEWDGVTVGICAYPQRYGAAFPVAAVNYAIWKILGQTTWNGSQLWVYPVRKNDDAFYSGLLIRSKMDDLEESFLVDDMMFKEVAEQNKKANEVNPWKSERFTIS